jgi:putative spermidine/putrescine transport system ATP-binding protein
MNNLQEAGLVITDPSTPLTERGGSSLKVTSVTKQYDAFRAVDDCNLTIESGEFLTLLGPSGSGKTTLLRMIAGFTAPSSGRLELDGVDITAVPPYRRDIGLVFQNYALFPHMSAAENIAFPLKMRGIKGRQRREMVDEALSLVKLEGFGHRKPRQMSGGQQQRVALARALVFRPRILLMDEPLGALDKRLREGLQVELRRLHRELGITIIFVTHDQEEALALSDRIAILRAGRIEQLGTGSELYESPASLFVADFMGESNVFEGRLERQDGAFLLVGDGFTLHVPSVAEDINSIGGQASLVVRPERLTLREASQPKTADLNTVRATLVDSLYLGSSVRHEVRMDDGRLLTVRGVGAVSAQPGDQVYVAWPRDRAVLVPTEVDAEAAKS